MVVLIKSNNAVVESEVNKMSLRKGYHQEQFDELYATGEAWLSESETIKTDDMIVAYLYRLRENGKSYTEVRKIISEQIKLFRMDE